MIVSPGLSLKDKELDLAVDFIPMLVAGYAIHLWNTGGSLRVAEIRGADDTRRTKGLLGYGVDITAIEALKRARNSYIMREADGKPFLSGEDFRNSDGGFINGYITGDWPDGTFLDKIASSNEVSIYQRGDVTIAKMPVHTFGNYESAQGKGTNIVEALVDLERLSGGKAF